MFVWTGQGWIGFLFIIAPMIVAKAYAGEQAFLHAPTVGLIILCSTIPCYFIGRRLNRDLPRRFWDVPKTELNPETGKLEHHPAQGHTVAYLRLEYAGLMVFFVLALLWLDHAGVFD